MSKPQAITDAEVCQYARNCADIFGRSRGLNADQLEDFKSTMVVHALGEFRKPNPKWSIKTIIARSTPYICFRWKARQLGTSPWLSQMELIYERIKAEHPQANEDEITIEFIRRTGYKPVVTKKTRMISTSIEFESTHEEEYDAGEELRHLIATMSPAEQAVAEMIQEGYKPETCCKRLGITRAEYDALLLKMRQRIDGKGMNP